MATPSLDPAESKVRPAALQRGALRVYADHEAGAPSSTIVFQYNPENLRRTLALRAPTPDPKAAKGAKQDVFAAAGPPVETINLTVELDAADQPAEPGQQRTGEEYGGLSPVLARLELLLYPATAQVKEREQQAKQGTAHAKPLKIPMVLLVFGRWRTVPVIITSFSISEEHFDTRLNPIHARVELGFRVLTDMELSPTSEGLKAFKAYHSSKETLAADAGGGMAQPTGATG